MDPKQIIALSHPDQTRIVNAGLSNVETTFPATVQLARGKAVTFASWGEWWDARTAIVGQVKRVPKKPLTPGQAWHRRQAILNGWR